MPDFATSEYARAQRAPQDVVLAQYNTFIGTHCRAFFDTLPTMILALNCFRQVVFANRAATAFLGRPDVENVLGERPGEILGCVNAADGSAGCGTSRHCRNCGMRGVAWCSFARNSRRRHLKGWRLCTAEIAAQLVSSVLKHVTAVKSRVWSSMPDTDDLETPIDLLLTNTCAFQLVTLFGCRAADMTLSAADSNHTRKSIPRLNPKSLQKASAMPHICSMNMSRLCACQTKLPFAA